MGTKNTILTEKRIKDIEDIIISSGRIVKTSDIRKSLKGKYSVSTLKKKIYELKKNGWLVPLKRGLYFVSDIASRGFVSVSPFVIAGTFVEDSYISLDSAFSFYNLFEQMLRTTSSVTVFKPRRYMFQENVYQYMKINKKLYFGYKTEEREGYYFKIAELEKAVLDYLYFKNDTYSVDMLIEILGKAKNILDIKKMIGYAGEYPQATKRKLGFILDSLKLDTEELYGLIERKGYSRLTVGSKKFNAKWRIYYEDRFVR